MYTMAEGGRFVTDWVGDPGAVVDYGVRFSAPIVVSDEEGATLEISGKVEKKLDDNQVVVVLTARSAEQKVLTQARATVRLA
jgi:N-acetylmuramoyl-L-alanine amidase